jgi:hypothetical protein
LRNGSITAGLWRPCRNCGTTSPSRVGRTIRPRIILPARDHLLQPLRRSRLLAFLLAGLDRSRLVKLFASVVRLELALLGMFAGQFSVSLWFVAARRSFLRDRPSIETARWRRLMSGLFLAFEEVVVTPGFWAVFKTDFARETAVPFGGLIGGGILWLCRTRNRGLSLHLRARNRCIRDPQVVEILQSLPPCRVSGRGLIHFLSDFLLCRGGPRDADGAAQTEHHQRDRGASDDGSHATLIRRPAAELGSSPAGPGSRGG